MKTDEYTRTLEVALDGALGRITSLYGQIDALTSNLRAEEGENFDLHKKISYAKVLLLQDHSAYSMKLEDRIEKAYRILDGANYYDVVNEETDLVNVAENDMRQP